MACGDNEFNRINQGQGDLSDVNVAIGCLKIEMKTLGDQLKSAGKEAKNFSGSFGGLGDVANKIKTMGKEMFNFTRDMKKQYALTEELAESYKKTSINIGLSVDRSKEFSQEFKRSAASIAEFGGNISDVEELYEEFIKNSGRVRILDEEEVTNIFKLQKATGMIGTESAEMYERFSLMGLSIESVTENMEQLIKDTQKIGLNSSKVIKVLANNMKTMQSYSFSNGIKGMTQMAKQAVKMRMDVSSVLQLADKFYQPEAAIEAAAELQLLGGDIAKAFGDPFTLMYEARNKPEELAKRIQDMTENMLQFNDISGEYELPAEARMQFQALDKQLGLGVDNLIEMSRQTAKLKDVKMRLSGSLFSEEEMEGIASMTKIKDGEFQVDVFDPNTQKRISKSIEDLSSGDVQMLLSTPKDEEDYMVKMIQNSQTTNERLKVIQDKFEKSFVAELDIYQQIESMSSQTIESFREFGEKGLSKIFDNLSKNDFSKILTDGFDKYTGGFDTYMKTHLDLLTNLFDTPFNIKDKMEINSTGVIKLNNNNINNKNQSGGSQPNMSKPQKDFLSRNDGTVTSFNNMDDVIGAKQGGPIDNLLKNVIPNNKTQKIEIVGNPKIDINITSNNPNMKFSEEEKNKVKNEILSNVTKMFNNGGSRDGVNLPQGSKGYIETLK
jgi:hypothetical protein